MANIESKFYRLPDGRVGKVSIELDDDASAVNPRENETTGAILVTWERDYHSPEPGEQVGSCWGYIGRDEFGHMYEQASAMIGDGAHEITESEYYDEAETVA